MRREISGQQDRAPRVATFPVGREVENLDVLYDAQGKRQVRLLDSDSDTGGYSRRREIYIVELDIYAFPLKERLQGQSLFNGVDGYGNQSVGSHCRMSNNIGVKSYDALDWAKQADAS